MSDGSRMAGGRLFQTRGPATANALPVTSSCEGCPASCWRLTVNQDDRGRRDGSRRPYSQVLGRSSTCEPGAVVGKNIWGACPPKFSLPSPPLFLTHFPALPPSPVNFPSHPCPPSPPLPSPFPIPSLSIFLIPSVPSLFPSPPLPFPSLPSP